MPLSVVFTHSISERTALRQRILRVTEADFDSLALDVFQYQARCNPLYATYLHHLRRDPATVQSIAEIPFLPISFFKTQQVLIPNEATAEHAEEAAVFASSGTTGATTSRHIVPDLALYDAVCQRLFEARYGPLDTYHILALLPSYLERNNSSLVYMVQRFMYLSGSDLSGFYLHNTDELTDHLRRLTDAAHQPNVPGNPPHRNVLLIGVTFGLLDWVERTPDLRFLGDLPGLVVMETGGMKGRRREMLREEVHAVLTDAMNVPTIHSEYGMTELLSQAYSTGEGVFQPSATLQVRLRDLNDPFYSWEPGAQSTEQKQTGGVNVIDLANLDSCAFIETQDLGQYVGTDGAFRIMGRFDNSDIRGCNLLVI